MRAGWTEDYTVGWPGCHRMAPSGSRRRGSSPPHPTPSHPGCRQCTRPRHLSSTPLQTGPRLPARWAPSQPWALQPSSCPTWSPVARRPQLHANAPLVQGQRLRYPWRLEHRLPQSPGAVLRVRVQQQRASSQWRHPALGREAAGGDSGAFGQLQSFQRTVWIESQAPWSPNKHARRPPARVWAWQRRRWRLIAGPKAALTSSWEPCHREGLGRCCYQTMRSLSSFRVFSPANAIDKPRAERLRPDAQPCVDKKCPHQQFSFRVGQPGSGGLPKEFNKRVR